MMSTLNEDQIIEVITIDSDDEDQLVQNRLITNVEGKSSESAIVLPKIQNVFQVEHFHSISNNDNVIKQSSEERSNTSSQNSEQGETTNLRLQRLAMNLADVLSGSLEVDKNSNINQMSNLEKTIWEVSQSNFDVSEYFSCTRSERFSSQQSKRFKKTRSNPPLSKKFEISKPVNEPQSLNNHKQSVPLNKKYSKVTCQQKYDNFCSEFIEGQSNSKNNDNNARPPIILKISKLNKITKIQNIENVAEIINSVSPSIVESMPVDENSKLGAESNIFKEKELDFYEESEDSNMVSSRSLKDVTSYQNKCIRPSITKVDSVNEDIYQRFLHKKLSVNGGNDGNEEKTQFTQDCVSDSLKDSKVSTSSSMIQGSKPLQHNHDLQIKLSEATDIEDEITETEFKTCYNTIFDDHVARLSAKMGDIIFLSIKEQESYQQRLTCIQKISCQQLREKESEIINIFKNELNEHKTSFSTMFHDIVTVIVANASSVKIQKSLILSWFIKLFLQLNSLLAEKSPISLWKIIGDLLSKYENPPQVMKDILTYSEVDFQKECWKTLNLILQCISDKSDENNIDLQNSAEEARDPDSSRISSNILNPPENHLGVSRNTRLSSSDLTKTFNEGNVENQVSITESASFKAMIQQEHLKCQYASQDHLKDSTVCESSVLSQTAPTEEQEKLSPMPYFNSINTDEKCIDKDDWGKFDHHQILMLKRNIASGNLAISRIKSLQTSNVSSQDIDNSVVTEATPSITIHKPNPQHQC